MHQTKKGNQRHFGMKCHTGVDAGSGFVHTGEATAANVHDVTMAIKLLREDYEVVYGDSAYLEFLAAGHIANFQTAPNQRFLKYLPSRIGSWAFSTKYESSWPSFFSRLPVKKSAVKVFW